MKVYIVRVGEYSDDEIHSVWSTERQAKRIVELIKNHDEYPNNTACIDEREVDKLRDEDFEAWCIKIKFDDGEILEAERFVVNQYNLGAGFQVKGHRKHFKGYRFWNGAIVNRGNNLISLPREGYPNFLQLFPENIRTEDIWIIGVAVTKEKALKQARDYRMKKLAELEGI